MALSSSQLEAFAAVAKSRNFSRAAKSLHITQSALSQRILNLEADLSTALIVRDPAGLRLAPAGEEILRYWQVRDGLEQEVLTRLATSQSQPGGTIRIAGFSSVTRSVIMPILTQLVAANPRVNIEIFSRELRELPLMLSRNEVDMIVTTHAPLKQELESHKVGSEEYVMVSAARMKARAGVYLDHDADDEVTAMFLATQGEPLGAIQRNFLDEIYAIIDGVRLGWGRAVVPKHLIKDDRDFKIVSGFKPMRVPVMLQYFRQAYYSKLHLETVACLRQGMPRILGG